MTLPRETGFRGGEAGQIPEDGTFRIEEVWYPVRNHATQWSIHGFGVRRADCTTSILDSRDDSADANVSCGGRAVNLKWLVEGCLLGRRAAAADIFVIPKFMEDSGPWSSRFTRQNCLIPSVKLQRP